MNKFRIGIFFGGSSSEKEVSLEGGRNVYQKLDTHKYERVPLFVDDERRIWRIPETLIAQNTTADLKARAEKEAQRVYLEDLPKLIDFAFVVGHGKFMEDGRLQGILEILNIPYNGTGVLPAALAANKLMSRRILEAEGIDVPRYMEISQEEFAKNKEGCVEKIAEEISYPCIVKPSAEGCSTAITKAKNKEDLIAGLEAAFAWDTVALVEEYLHGMEVTASVVGNENLKALPVTETPPSGMQEFLTLEDKFLPGGAQMITPARLPKKLLREVESVALGVCKALNLTGYPRIDMFVVGERAVVLEANTLPGITPSTMIFHQAAAVGFSPSQYLDRIIELGLQAHKRKVGPL